MKKEEEEEEEQFTRAHISRDPKAFQPQRAESKLTYSTTIIK